MDLQKQTIHDHGSSVRMKTMDWMRLPEYELWLIFTDCCPCQTPKFYWRFSVWFGPYNMSFGYDAQVEPTGPPQPLVTI